ncbi:MAG: hypothetical protein ACRD96_19995 [Bryobacteraceae bacterium]
MRAALLLIPCLLVADVAGCACDPARPETLGSRDCGLCVEAEKHPPDTPLFFLKDINPRKPNRWLALPRAHGKAQHSLAALAPHERTRLWTAAIEKARSLFGDKWGLAINGDEVRTQCHAHIHIGRLIEGMETGSVVTVDGPAAIAAPPDGSGLWVHAEGSKLHVHTGEQLTETVLLR